MSVIWETQKAVYEKLSGDDVLDGLVSGVFDRVPEKKQFPYVVIGNITARDNSALGAEIYELVINISAYSKTTGRKECLEIVDRVKLILDKAVLEIAGFEQMNMLYVSSGSEVFLRENIYRGNIEFKMSVRKEE